MQTAVNYLNERLDHLGIVVSFGKGLLALTIAYLLLLNSSWKNQTPICMFVVENNIPRTISQQYDPY